MPRKTSQMRTLRPPSRPTIDSYLEEEHRSCRRAWASGTRVLDSRQFMALSLQAMVPHSDLVRQRNFVDSQASLLLDLVRALAAFVVLCEHWRNIFFVDYGILASHKAFFLLPYLLVSAGHQAIVIFFVLSGYLISGSVFRMFQRGVWSWRTYLLHRLARLWVVLVPGLVLTALLDRIGMSLHRAPAAALYSGLSGNHLLGDVHALSSPLIGLANLLFLQGISVPTFGSDGALWSLANEFWYYMLFPLAFVAVRRQTAWESRVLHASLFVAAAWLLRHSVLGDFPIWLLGTLLAVLPVPRFGAAGPWIRWLAVALYVPLFYAFARAPSFQVAVRDDLLGLATFVFLWILLSASHPASTNSPATRCTRLLARFSYTLYVAHTPMLVLIAALLLGPTRWLPDGPHVAIGLVILFLVLALCLLLASQTEFRTDALRNAMERRLHVSG